MPKAGLVVHAVRNYRKIKMDEFAESIGIKVPTLYRLERDDPRVLIANLARAALKLGIRFDAETREAELPPDMPESVFRVYERKIKTSADRRMKSAAKPLGKQRKGR